MSLPTQLGFWQDKILADTRSKLAELYQNEPKIAHSEKQCILQFWTAYEGLHSLLGDKFPDFSDWFLEVTSPETITRCLRSLKEDGTIQLTPQQRQKKQKHEQEWRQHWGKQRGLRDE
jgi:hypothetical protein